LKGGINMRVMERGGRYKGDTGYRLLPEAPTMTRFVRFVPPTAGVNVLLEAVRQKRADAIGRR
jgi:hypothetical protein